MSFSSEPALDELKNYQHRKRTGFESEVSSIHFVHSGASCWQSLNTLLTVLTNNGIILQKYQYYARIMPDAPAIVLNI